MQKSKNITIGLVALILLVLLPSMGFAADYDGYDSGYGALEVFSVDNDIDMPLAMQIWLPVMAGSFMLGLFFVVSQPIARWLVGGFALGFLAHEFPFHVEALGLPMLSGMISIHHLVLWSPGLYLLLTNRPWLNSQGLFRYWSAWITLIILISFFFDIRDAFIYIGHVAGLAG